jgi:acyl carrier protein
MSEAMRSLERMIREVMQDLDPARPIIPGMRFNQDLELESIEFVALAERLTEQYRGRVDFASWLGAKDLQEIIGLTVGDVAEYIDQCLSSEPTA